MDVLKYDMVVLFLSGIVFLRFGLPILAREGWAIFELYSNAPAYAISQFCIRRVSIDR